MEGGRMTDALRMFPALRRKRTRIYYEHKVGRDLLESKTTMASSIRSPRGLTFYFIAVLLSFSIVSVLVNILHGHYNWNDQTPFLQGLKNKDWKITEANGQSNKDEPKHAENNNSQKTNHELAGLNCEPFGGPSPEIAKEMVYWQDIPSDASYVSPFKRKNEVQYMTFEPDAGGWNNIRMSMETVLAMAYAMGRTLVLPPDQSYYLLDKDAQKHKTKFSFAHFFHMESIAEEHTGLEIITMRQFLERHAMQGKMMDSKTGKTSFPPNNRTDWDGEKKSVIEQELSAWLRTTTQNTIWDPERCMVAFAANASDGGTERLQQYKTEIEQDHDNGFGSYEEYVGKPSPVDAPPKVRMRENWANRQSLCIYNKEMQEAPVVHFPMIDEEEENGARLLVHFYAFLFFEDWKQDLWMKRFVRDHVRYIDEIQCAAARVVHAIRERATQKGTSKNGEFDSMHVRRGDFQYTETRISAEKLYNVSQDEFTEGATLYIATDERDKSFFEPLARHYDVVYLDDFLHLIPDLNTNFYGLVDQLVSSRGRVFFGCWFSTFSSYINRMRGYHADFQKLPGYEQGVVESYYYARPGDKNKMKVFYPVKRTYHSREYPAAWRGIDKGIGEL